MRHTDMIEDAKDSLAAAYDRNQVVSVKIDAYWKQAFLAAGGCDRCHGRGLIVVWDTLDCMDGSAAEYGTCPECKGEKRQGDAAYDHTHHSKHDRWMNTYPTTAAPTLPADIQKEWDEAKEAINTAQVALDSLTKALDPKVKGAKVQVFKGRKVPVGTVGTVFWIGKSKGYNGGEKDRLGLKDADNNTIWVDAEHCERVLASIGG
jgi:hypothetical protein